jgi:hypothetical protein
MQRRPASEGAPYQPEPGSKSVNFQRGLTSDETRSAGLR